jgi:glycolate oxidase FAD binding subunit
VLGTILLSAQGELLHFGGKVIKNVAGFDLSRLLCGSLGILGAITEVSLKCCRCRARSRRCDSSWPQSEALAALQPLGRPAAADFRHRLACRARPGCACPAHQSALQYRLRARLGGELLRARMRPPYWWRSLRDQTHAFFSQCEHAVASCQYRRLPRRLRPARRN